MKYGDGLVFVVDNSLEAVVYLDDVYIGKLALDLGEFLRLRRLLLDTDDVAVLTLDEARDVAEELAAEAKA